MPQSPAHERVTKVLVLLTKFRKDGTVQLLSKHKCDASSGPAVYYLQCVERLRDEDSEQSAVMLTSRFFWTFLQRYWVGGWVRG